MSSIHVALFMPSLGGGGAERVMLKLAETFVDRRFRVVLLVTKARGRLSKDVPYNVRLADLRARRIATSRPALATYIGREKPAVLPSAMASANCLAIWARELNGVQTYFKESAFRNRYRAKACTAKLLLRQIWSC